MTAPTLTPVVLNLGIREYLPDDADLPTAARKAVQAWVKAEADRVQAQQDVQAANVAYITTHDRRKEEEQRAIGFAEPVVWPERDALKEAQERFDRLTVLAQVMHDDAARAIKDAAPAALADVDAKAVPAAMKAVGDAVDVLEAALRRLELAGGLRAYWQNVVRADGGGGQRTNVQVGASQVLVNDPIRGRVRVGTDELIGKLRSIEGTL